jgi:hypothetical protein
MRDFLAPLAPGGSMEHFIERQNVAHYKELLKTETNLAKRAVLLN